MKSSRSQLFIGFYLCFFVAAGIVNGQPAETWISTGQPTTLRREQSTTLLQNGWVLMAGGGTSSGVTNSAELFNPETGQWQATTSLNTARANHEAILMPSGKVFVVGGQGPGALGSSELFDPATAAWTTVCCLNVPRMGHTASLLTAERVLVTGGLDSAGNVLNSVEIFDSSSQLWILRASMSVGRDGHTATSLADGRVLVTGGFAGAFGGGWLKSCEIFDGDTVTWTPTGDMDVGREDHAAALLADGRVLVSGGYFTNATIAAPESEIFDPETGGWDPTAAMQDSRIEHRLVGLSDGRVLAAGGFDSQLKRTAEIFDPARGRWEFTQQPLGDQGSESLTLLSDGRVLTVGRDSQGPTSATMDFVQLMYPQFALGGGFEVVLLLSNNWNQPWRGLVKLNSGLWPATNAWSLNGEDRTGEPAFDVELDRGQTKKFVVSSSEGPFSGWLEISSGHPLAQLSTSFFYNFYSGSELIDSTGVAPAYGSRRVRVSVEKTDTINTGIAIRRSGDVIARLYDEHGVLLQTQTVTQQGAKFIDEIFSGVSYPFVGSVTIDAPRKFYVTFLRQEVTSRSPLKFQLTSIPAVSVP